MIHFARIVAAAVMAVSLAAPVASQCSTVCTRTYTVQPGDTCNSIGASQHVSNFQLLSANTGTINSGCTNLFVGQSLCLGLGGADCDVVAVVGSGDTCPTIASAAGITVKRLLDMNPNVNSVCSNIAGGDVLCVSP